MNKKWLRLRDFDGSQANAFEELVCQIARSEEIPGKEKFIRVGNPDGGVEAYCVLSSGEEYGWQAKFFDNLSQTSINQLDKSIKSALKTHPNLTKYYVCIPFDLPDPRTEKKGKKQKSAKDKWDDWVSKWSDYAEKQGRALEVELWGSSELLERLTKPEHEGRRYYWFNDEEFSDKWFEERLEENIENLGKRYTPELNYELPISEAFDGLARNSDFKERFKKKYYEFLKQYNKSTKNLNEQDVSALFEKLQESKTSLQKLFDTINFDYTFSLDDNAFYEVLKDLDSSTSELIYKLYDLKEKAEKVQSDVASQYSWKINELRNLSRPITYFKELIASLAVKLYNNPSLMLMGDAGTGKSHLLADVAKRREKNTQNTILLLGQHFKNDEIWTQIKKQLGLNCSKEELLGALDVKAEISGERILIFIDAINEGDGKSFWKDSLLGFITSIKRYSNLGIVFSLRSTYKKAVLPPSFEEGVDAVITYHEGFSGHEYEVIKLFFDNFGIMQPTIPLLSPEFSNPLFLRLFCEGLSNKKGCTFDGSEGFSQIVDLYFFGVNKTLEEKYNISQKLGLLETVVDQFIEKVWENNGYSLAYSETYSLIGDLLKKSHIDNVPEVFNTLILEGVFIESPDYQGGEVVYFTYERLGDYLTAKYLLNKHFNPQYPDSFLSSDSRLKKIIEEGNGYYKKGLLDALSIQLPEKYDIELYELGDNRDLKVIAESFIDSTVWRDKNSIGKKVIPYIRQEISEKFHLGETFLQMVLQVTAVPDHFFNSDYLHNILSQQTMARRDGEWTQFIHEEYHSDYGQDNVSNVKRIIDWLIGGKYIENLSRESVRLICQTIAWFLTSSDRVLRDDSTKALICLLQDKIDFLSELLKCFSSIYEPYISQRLYAVAYGCAVRTKDTKSLLGLGNYIFDTVFDTDKVVPDILLRDYARGIIDYACHVGHKFTFDIEKTRPPFKSDMPAEFPTNEEIKKYSLNPPEDKKYQHSQNTILWSMDSGDFGRYVAQSNLERWKKASPKDWSNYATKLIFEKFGYDVEMHGSFDRELTLDYIGRMPPRIERIGKKYQWIAFHEILAIIADNYEFYDYDELGLMAKPYNGPWQRYIRDIDPTFVFSNNSKLLPSKWKKEDHYGNWNIRNSDWVKLASDIPKTDSLVSSVDEGGAEWFFLNKRFAWDEPTSPEKEKYQTPHKQLNLKLSGYYIRKDERSKFIDCLKNRNLKNFFFEEAESDQVYSREPYWAAPFYSSRSDPWQEMQDPDDNSIIGSFAEVCRLYYWEQYGSSERIIQPSQVTFDILQLQYARDEGHFFNKEGTLTCLDPSLNYDEQQGLMVRKKDFLEALEDNGLEVIWTVFGTKSIFGDYSNRQTLYVSDVLYLDSGKLISNMHKEFEE